MTTEAEPNDGLTEALANIPADQPAPAPADGGQARDAQGRFAGREEPAADQGQPQTERNPDGDGEDEGGRVPAWRLRELREERDRERAAREADRREAEEARRELAALKRERAAREAEQARPEMPDPYIDPEGYAQWVRDEARREAEEVRRETTIQRLDASFEDAKEQHGERFIKAYEAAMAEKASGNRQLVDRIAKSPNPGRALMKWYGEQEALRETGGDLTAYRKRTLDEALKDPEHRKAVLAAMEAEARGGGGTIVERSNITDLPSLTRAAGGSARGVGTLGTTDGEIYESLTRRGSRR